MSSFAKITRPVLSAVFPRERLFERLRSAFLSHPIAWVAAPAGSGKTVLAASFVQAQKTPSLWFQIDARDADPPSFFYYLRTAAGLLPSRGRGALPLLTPEYGLDVEGYARSFFEQLGQRLPRGALLVLDDYHELPEDSPLQRLMPVALASLPETVRVLVASRAAPPRPFARLAAHGRIASVPAAELNLTDEETGELARVQRLPGVGPSAAAALRRRTGGWLAGTILLLEGSASDPGGDDELDPSARVALFEYFAAEIFDRAPEETRRFLLETAFMPQVNVRAAVSLTGEERSGEILADLVRRNYFTLRLAGPEPQYQYHPLFRAFLRSHARRALPADACGAVTRRAIEVLRRHGAVEDAAALMVEAGDHAGLSQLVLDAAPALVRQGRLAVVEGWLRALPDGLRDASPWLSYWLGVCRAPFAPAEARPHLERSYRLFEAREDATGMLLAWAAYAKTFVYVWDEFAGIDPWIAEMRTLLRRHPGFPSLEIEADVTLGMMAGLMWRQSGHPELRDWVARATALLDAELAPEFRMQLAVYLALYGLWWTGDIGSTARLLDQMRPLLSAPDVTPHTELLWHVMKAGYHGRIGDRAGCYAAVERGLATAERSGVAVQNLSLTLQGVTGALASGDLEGAARYHELGRPWLQQDNGATNVSHWHLLGAWIALCAHDLGGARAHALPMVRAGRRSAVDFAAPWIGHTMANLLLEEGRYDEGVGVLERCLGWARRTHNPVVAQHALLSIAHARLCAGRPDDALAPLEEGFRIGREHRLVSHPWTGWRRDVMARLSALALEHGMEVEHVRAQVQAARLCAPAPAPDAWPFDVRIQTLGRFEVSVGADRLSFAGRTHRRPLELLKVIVALGGREVREDAISAALWPDADGDAAHHALETTLYRLRKLLGPGAVLQRDRCLSFDPAACWADALAVEAAAARILKAVGEPPRGGAPEGDRAPAALDRELERVAQLYRGPFLAADADDLPWAAAARDRLRRTLARVLTALERSAGPHGPSRPAARLAAHLAEVDPALVPASLRDGAPASGAPARRISGA